MRIVDLLVVPALVTALAACSGTINSAPGDADGEEEGALIPWSALTGEIAYLRSSYGGTLGSHLFVIETFSQEVRFLNGGAGRRLLNVAWGSSEDPIVFADYDANSGIWQLSAIHPDSTESEALFPSDGDCNYPAWSPDGRLAYWFDGQDPHTDEIRIDGQPLLTGFEANRTRPAWSPDGRYLVVSMRDTISQGSLFRVDLCDTTITLLHQASGEWNAEVFYSPMYSPDGETIAFTRTGTSILNESELWLMNADGSGPTALTTGHYDWYPAWSPDGRYIAFQRGITGPSLYLFELDTGATTEITVYDGSFPAWVQ